MLLLNKPSDIYKKKFYLIISIDNERDWRNLLKDEEEFLWLTTIQKKNFEI
jgi:hypothetical protein